MAKIFTEDGTISNIECPKCKQPELHYNIDTFEWLCLECGEKVGTQRLLTLARNKVIAIRKKRGEV